MRADPESVVLAGSLIFGGLGGCHACRAQHQSKAERD
jgi:hypothetical protein